jgi:hypothetical protein
MSLPVYDRSAEMRLAERWPENGHYIRALTGSPAMHRLLRTVIGDPVRRSIAERDPGFWVPSSKEYETFEPPPVPSMTTPFELCLFEAFARDAYTGRGLIVDLGCWLGATTYCLARGLVANKRVVEPPPIHAYDVFVWNLYMDEMAQGAGYDEDHLPGDSYYEETQRFLARYGELVRLLPQYLIGYQPPREPLEFLLVDAQKSWPLGHSITTGFFPLLLPKRSYVVQQDFCYHKLNEVQTRLIMWYLRDHFECVHHVPESCSVVFRCTKEIDANDLPAFWPDLFDLEQVHEAYDYCYGCVGAADRAYLRVGKICHLVAWGHLDAACSEATALSEDGTAIYESSRRYAMRFLDGDRTLYPAGMDRHDPASIAEIRRALANAQSAGD